MNDEERGDDAGPAGPLIAHVTRAVGAIDGIWSQIVPGPVRTDVIVVGPGEAGRAAR